MSGITVVEAVLPLFQGKKEREVLFVAGAFKSFTAPVDVIVDVEMSVLCTCH